MTDTLKAGLDELVESLDAEAWMRPFEALKKAGFIGCASGPADLAANYKRYLSGSLERLPRAPGVRPAPAAGTGR